MPRPDGKVRAGPEAGTEPTYPPPPRGAFIEARSSQLVEITITLGFVWFSMLLGFARLSHRSARSASAPPGFVRLRQRLGSFGSRVARVRSDPGTFDLGSPGAIVVWEFYPISLGVTTAI